MTQNRSIYSNILFQNAETQLYLLLRKVQTLSLKNRFGNVYFTVRITLPELQKGLLISNFDDPFRFCICAAIAVTV